MSPSPNRRTILRGVAAGAVIGLDPLTGAWARAADRSARQSASGQGLVDVPPLDGTLLTDDASLSEAADDFGHIVHLRPTAVLRPGSVDDIVTMVRFCDAHGVKVAARGQGHAAHGGGQVDGGLVIETAPLADIVVGPDTVTAGAGAVWSAVVKATLRHGLTPPVFTDYLELSVGGTLSVGGIGGQAHLHGAQVDNVTELQVVTGSGELLRCSPDRHPDLFDAVLAGLGQCGIIVRATIRLVTAPETVRHYLLPYEDLRTFLGDERVLADDHRFAYVEGQVIPGSGYVLEAVAYGPPAGPEPDDTELLRGLRFTPGSGVQITDLGYFDFLNRIAADVAALESSGAWYFPHPWLNLMLPGRTAADLAEPLIDSLVGQDLGPGGLILCYPLVRARLRTPLLRVPDDPVVYLLAVLRTGPPDADAAPVLAANRAAYEAARDGGGTQYPVGAIPFAPADWRAQFGPVWPRLAAAKQRYDPCHTLAPGQNVF